MMVLSGFARSITRNYTRPAYALKVDVANFFNAIDRHAIERIIRKDIGEGWCLDLLLKIIWHDPRKRANYRSSPALFKKVPKHTSLMQSELHTGLPIGNLTSQFFANVYLNELDQFVKHKLKCRYYGRYVDDMVLFHQNPKVLNKWQQEIDGFLQDKLSLHLHPNKIWLNRVDKGIDFVGFMIKPGRTYMRTHSLIIIDDILNVIAGHGRLEAAKLLRFKEVPCIQVGHLSKEEVRAYRLADNQLTMNTGYDDDLLRVEITDLMSLDLDFNLEITGFETAELDIIIDGIDTAQDDPADHVPDIEEDALLVTKPSDVWQLGNHRLICGDALDSNVYQSLMQESLAHAIFTDPPYNVKIDGHVCGNGKIKHNEFAMASGEMSEDEFTQFLSKFIANAIQFSIDGSLHYIYMDWRHMFELLGAGRAHYSDLKNICVWNKDNGGMGSLYRSKHELVAVFKHGTEKHINNIELGKYGRYRTNVWDYAGVNGFANQEDLKLHPTVKPVAMITDAIKDCTKRGHIVLDPFAGSGSTLIACEKSGRAARCIEFEPKYCDVIIRRWQDLTGNDAVHTETNQTFIELENLRGDHHE